LDILSYQSDFITFLESQKFSREPKNLYEPVDYILRLGGKRIRPMLTLIAADVFSNDYQKALPAAFAVEVFHNFTLVHDDIMDDAPLRRGKETVHEKWNINTGILSGDAMLILAYQYFENYEPETFQKLAQLFSKTALEVFDEYIKMITLKTSVLVAAALKMGAIVAKADEEQAQHLYNYGLNLGIAFQLQDDYLDTFGDPESFGKQVGGDIIENKKTYLYLKALEVANSTDKENLLNLYNGKQKNNTEKVTTVSAIFKENNIPEETHKLIEYYTDKSFENLSYLNISDKHKEGLRAFGKNLMSRKV
jgi:geranylgeranyl diphosphate synthase type II